MEILYQLQKPIYLMFKKRYIMNLFFLVLHLCKIIIIFIGYILSKISKKMRNDAIVLRIANMDDAKAIANFINNNLNYHPKYHPNPFLYSEGKVAYTMDGKISYNA